MSDETDTTSEVAPYTPGTIMVRLAYLVATKDDDPEWTRKRARAEFDRWLDGEKAKAVADAQAQQAQIATQEPTGAPQAESGGSRVSGGLGERLRALMLRAVEPGTLAVPVPVGELRRIAAELDRLEVHARVIEQSLRTARGELTRAEAVIERVEALAESEHAHGDAVTRCNLVAQRIRDAIDGPREGS